MSETLPWILAALGIFGALLAGLRLRQASVSLAASRLDAERLGGELQSTRAQLEKASAKQRRSGDELAELRKRLDKLRRREGKAASPGGPGGTPGAAGAQSQALEREIEEARQARDAARSEAAGLAEELERLRSEQVEESPAVLPLLDNAGIEALQKREREAATRVRALEQDHEKAKSEIERLKAKARTQESLYVSMRGDLEAKKDRLRRQQEDLERLQALKVAVVDPLPADDETGRD